MKKYILVAFIFFSNFTFAQINETDKIATFCKVWGFLKYYHPDVSKGKADWDSVFKSRLQVLSTLDNKNAINKFYSGWIKNLGEVPACKKCSYKPIVTSNYDNNWISDEKVFSNEVAKQLQWIEANRNNDTNFYVQQFKNVGNTNYVNEKPYADSVLPSAELDYLVLPDIGTLFNTIFHINMLLAEIGKRYSLK